MRVLVLLSGNDVGGAERAAAQLTRALLDRGDDVKVVGPTRDDYPTPLDEVHQVPLCLDPRDRFRGLLALGALRRLVRAWRPDVVYAVHRWPTRLVTLAVPRRRARVIYHAQSLVEPRPLPAWGDVTVAVSEAVRGRIVEQGADPRQIVVIPNAADLGPADPPTVAGAGEHLERLLGDAPITVVAAGRLVPGKGFEHLVDAAAPLETVRVAIVGDGPMRGELERRIAERAPGRIAITGWVDDARPYLAVGDLVVVPSDHYPEGMPLVIVEAMALSLPVIGTRISGISEVVSDGQTGVLVEPGDVMALRDAIAGLAHDDRRRAAFGRSARALVEERFSTDVVVAQLLDVVDGVIP